MYECFACLYVCALHVYLLAAEVRRSWVLKNWSYSELPSGF